MIFFKLTNKALRDLILLLGAAMAAFSLTSCFTGVESTKKIKLSREDKKAMAPSQEEIFFSGIEGEPLSDWQEGRKKFLVVDNKAMLMFEHQVLPGDTGMIELENKILTYKGVTSRIDPAGNLNTVIIFDDSERNYRYNTGKNPEQALQSFLSDQIPMLIDLYLVGKARNLLTGKQLWTRSPLWYDSIGERITGKKFVPVTVTDVTPGNFVFPLKVKIKDREGVTAYMFMNYGHSGNESRSFHNLFSLSDLRNNFRHISDENWDYICRGKVKTGMTKEECKLALGNPSDVNSGHDYSQTLDIWSYENGVVLWFVDGLLSRFRD